MTVRYTDITFRPIDGWPGELTENRRRSLFSARWGQTIELLERELGHLDARNVVFQIAVDDRDIRLDGKPRAQARAAHPGVILAFDSKYGPLKYAVDTFTSFDDNVRAVALAMESLRAVDRYGVTKRGEQYTGWRAIPQTTSGDPGALINTPSTTHAASSSPTAATWRRAARDTHPDAGGDPDEFRKIMRAKELLA